MKHPLDSANTRRECLALVRATGRFNAAYEALGISQKSFERYKQRDEEFALECQEAKVFHAVQQQLTYGGELKMMAFKELIRRIEAGTISDLALLRVLFDFIPVP